MAETLRPALMKQRYRSYRHSACGSKLTCGPTFRLAHYRCQLRQIVRARMIKPNLTLNGYSNDYRTWLAIRKHLTVHKTGVLHHPMFIYPSGLRADKPPNYEILFELLVPCCLDDAASRIPTRLGGEFRQDVFQHQHGGHLHPIRSRWNL